MDISSTLYNRPIQRERLLGRVSKAAQTDRAQPNDFFEPATSVAGTLLSTMAGYGVGIGAGLTEGAAGTVLGGLAAAPLAIGFGGLAVSAAKEGLYGDRSMPMRAGMLATSALMLGTAGAALYLGFQNGGATLTPLGAGIVGALASASWAGGVPMTALMYDGLKNGKEFSFQY